MRFVSFSAFYKVSTVFARRGFTLLELLAVIGIIAVLTSVLLPALGAMKTKGKESQARADITLFVNACRLFEADYGNLPNPGATSFASVDSSTFAKASANIDGNYTTLLSALTCVNYLSSSALSISTLNPRLKRYMDPMAKYSTNGFVDPWGSSYGVFIDAAGVGQLTVAYPSGSKTASGATLSSETLFSRVAVYSPGSACAWSSDGKTFSASNMDKAIRSWK